MDGNQSSRCNSLTLRMYPCVPLREVDGHQNFQILIYVALIVLDAVSG